MWLQESKFNIRLGGNNYIDCPVLVQFQKTPLFSLVRSDDGYLAINFEVYDARRTKLASVARNNIYVVKGATDAYALDGDADRVTLIERASGTMLAEVKKRAAAAPAELEVTLSTYLPNGARLEMGPDSTNLGGIISRNNTIKGSAVGIQIG